MAAEMVASTVVPLLVGLFNLLVAGYALAAGAKDRRLWAFALGPGGVGLWALAWFVFVFQQERATPMRLVGATGGLVAMLGYAVDALWSWPRRWIWTGVALAAAVLLGLGLLSLGVLADRYELDFWGVGLRAGALVAGALTFVARADQWRRGVEPAFARWVVGSALLTAVAFGGFALLAYLGQRDFVDVLLFVILWAELLALGYIAYRRVEVRVLVSRSASYGILSVAVAGAAALLFRVLGYAVDPVVLAVTVALSLMASALFMGLGGRLALAVERLLFPEQARLEAALVASKTELAGLRRRLERAEKLAIAGELAASVAHEIKNPLAPIKGYAQMLGQRLQRVSEEERAFFEKGLRIIQEEADRIDGRIAQLLALARGDKVGVSRDDTTDLHRVIREAAAVAEGEPGLEQITQRFDASLGRVHGNEDELRGALLNLLKNAVEAMHGTDGKHVEVLTRREGDTAVIEVRDEGPGLDPSQGEQVFATFFTTKQGGTGLGLAIARSAVEAAGGTLNLRSRSDRRGAVACIELPLAKESP